MQTKVLKKATKVRYNINGEYMQNKNLAQTIEFCHKLGIEDKDISTIVDYKIGRIRYAAFSFLLAKSPKSLLLLIKKHKDKRRLFLEFFVRYAANRRKKYLDYYHGDETAFYTHFRDIAIWLDNCKRQFNTVGIDEANWVINMFTLYVVRIGRLQYETTPYKHDYTPELKQYFATSSAHTIHIPRDGKLDLEEVKFSLKAAAKHFNTNVFFCRSWLLSPEINSLLPNNSNIRSFSDLFTPMGSIPSRQAEQFLFTRILDHPQDYQATTSLQLAVKNHLINGGVLSEGMGIVEVDKL